MLLLDKWRCEPFNLLDKWVGCQILIFVMNDFSNKHQQITWLPWRGWDCRQSTYVLRL